MPLPATRGERSFWLSQLMFEVFGVPSQALFGKGVVRADGRKVHDAYLFQVKTPQESKYSGDYYKLRATIPAAEAFRPLKDGGCPLVTN